MTTDNLFWFGLLGGAVKLSFVIPYFYQVFKKGIRPNRASWFIWSVVAVIAFFGQLAKGASYSLFMSVGEALACFSIFLLSVFKGEGGYNRFDLTALTFALAGLVLWGIFKQPILSLWAVVFADFMGLLPTYRKSFKDPARESRIVYFMSGTGSLLTCFSVGAWNFSLLLYPFWLTVGNYAVIVFSYFGRILKNRTL